MKCPTFHRLLPACLFLLNPLHATAFAKAAADSHFRVHPIPGPQVFLRETLLPADIDKDGDFDFFSGGGRGSTSDWYENLGPAGWSKHLVSDSNNTDVGGAIMDVDGDGWLDKVAGTFWYRNPGRPRDTVFEVCRDSTQEFVHDMLAADMDGDGRPDILNIDFDGIRWFSVPRDSHCLPWKEHRVSGFSGDQSLQMHGGIATGDIDGDGDMDVSRLDRWFENADGKGETWTEHTNIDFGTVWSAGWGLSGKAVILDMDGDGAMDLVQTECDLPNGRVAWFRNRGGKGLDWERQLIKDSTDGQDYHTLTVADYDGDGDLDVFSMGSGNSDSVPKGYLWENSDGKAGTWNEYLVFVGEAGHEGASMDADGDGDLDILLKARTTGGIFYLENLKIPPSSLRRGRSGPGTAGPARKDPPLAIKPWARHFRWRGLGHDARGKLDPG